MSKVNLFLRGVDKETVYKLRVAAAKAELTMSQMLDRIMAKAA